MKNRADSETYILQDTLDEQRRFHAEITNSFDNMKSKIILYIGAILAVLTFLYSGALDSGKTMREKLFIPEELYGMLFYFFGVACLVYALAILIRAMRMNIEWEVYSETSERRVIGGIDKTLAKNEYLQAMVDGYEDATNKNLKSHAVKAIALKSSFSPMVAGAIILVVLRFFQ